MNRQQFIDLVKNPALANAQTIRMIEEVVKRYPYFQAGHFLLAYNLYREESLQYPVQIRKAAAYAADRSALKELIDQAQKQVSVPGNRIDEQKASFMITPNEADISEVPKSNTKGAESALQVESCDTELPSHPESVTLPGVIPTLAEPVDESHERMTQKELLFVVRKRLSEIEAGRMLSNDSSESSAEGVFFISKTEDAPDMFKETKSKNDLIDNFIREEPTISKPKATFFHPSDSAHRSNFDEEEIVSETLAQLYARQGNISKAIHIYKKLSLLNQEKSRYFAAQIEKLGQ
ncbi:MAG: hypothetical protein EOM90_05295 [Alphaproteobacteria bacterium]|nr:hypothetical protein [Alphaproteobacteria bacterium]